MTPVQDVSDDGSMHAASQAALPMMTPPASMIRVATVASYIGTQGSPSGSRPLRHRIPANAMLSFKATRLPSSSEEVGAMLLASHFVDQAQPLDSSALLGIVISPRGYMDRSGTGKSSSSSRRSCTLLSNPPRRMHQSSISSSDKARPAFDKRPLTSLLSSFDPLQGLDFAQSLQNPACSPG